MGKTKCPRCHRFFEDDFDRYVVGTATNTLKFGVNMVCRLSGSALGGFLGNTMGKIGGKVGGAIADSLGCGIKDMNGWHHKCPYCKHKWR